MNHKTTLQKNRRATTENNMLFCYDALKLFLACLPHFPNAIRNNTHLYDNGTVEFKAYFT
jgi:hypothetical protein